MSIAPTDTLTAADYDAMNDLRRPIDDEQLPASLMPIDADLSPRERAAETNRMEQQRARIAPTNGDDGDYQHPGDDSAEQDEDSFVNAAPEKPIESSLPAKIAPVTLGELWRSDPELREPIIDGLIRRGQVGNLISTSKSYKTYLVLGLAISMATGREWLDRFAVIGGRVLLIDLELQPGDITRRTHDIAQAMHADLAAVANGIDIISLRGRAAHVGHIEHLLMGVAPRTYSLVIIDPLYKTYPPDFDENSNAQMTALYRQWERMAEHLDAALFIVHHGTKGSQSEKRVVDVGAGASAQSRSADAHIALREHQTPGCVVMEARIRSFAGIDPMVLRWEYPIWVRDLAGDPQNLKTGARSRNVDRAEPQPKEKPVKWTPERFVEKFLAETPKSEASIITSAAIADLAERPAKRLLMTAVESGIAYRWVYPERNKPHQFSTVPQPVLASGSLP